MSFLFYHLKPAGYIKSYINKNISSNTCNLTMAQETIFYRHYFMAVPKKSPYAQELDKALVKNDQDYNKFMNLNNAFESINFKNRSLWWHAFGLQNYWMKKGLPKESSHCLLNYNEKDQSVKLLDKVQFKLGQFYVTFVALFVGYVLALVQFLRERLIRY